MLKRRSLLVGVTASFTLSQNLSQRQAALRAQVLADSVNHIARYIHGRGAVVRGRALSTLRVNGPPLHLAPLYEVLNKVHSGLLCVTTPKIPIYPHVLHTNLTM